MKTFLLISSASVKDKWDQINTKLLFIFSVRYTNTMEQNGTVIAENGFTGCHFSICVYHNESNSATYGDSLG